MAAPVRIRVRDHRFRSTPDKQALMPVMEQVLPSLGEVLQRLVGETVEQVISQGRWHRSRNRRYDYYRTWLEYRYGSSRARRNRGSAGTREEPTPTHDGTRSNLPQALDHNDALDRLKFNFLVRVLQKNARVSGQQDIVMGPAIRRRRKNSSAATYEAGIYDVTGALQQINQMRAQYQQRASQDGKSAKRKARKAYQKGVQDFLYGANDYNRFFRESRLGQKYMRYAEVAAMRHQRNTKVLYGPSSYGQHMTDTQMRLFQRRAEAYRDAVQVHQQGRGSPPNIVPTGGYAWGHQTGTLARAWSVAQHQLERLEDVFRISISPDDSPDGRTPGAATLTKYLKRNIQRQGGNPDFLNAARAQELIRDAVGMVQTEWAKRGIRLRR